MSFYYNRFRTNPPVRAGYIGGDVRRASLVHLSLLLGLVHPLGVLMGPLLCILTMGETRRNIENEAFGAFNFGVVAALCHLGILAVDELGSLATEGRTFPLVFLTFDVALVFFVWRAVKTVRQGRPYDYRYSVDALQYPAPGTRGATLAADVGSRRPEKRSKK